MLRKVSLVVVLVLVMIVAPRQAVARDMKLAAGSALGSVAELETALWGVAKDGSALVRTAELEKAVFGATDSGPILQRLVKLGEYLLPGHANAFNPRVSALEQALLREVSSEPLAQRFSRVEGALMGSPAEGTFRTRLEKDLRAVGIDGYKISVVEVPQGTPVRVRIPIALSTESASADQNLIYEVAQSVVVDGAVVVAAGARGYAHVTTLKPAGAFGRDASIGLDFCTVTGVDGDLIPLGAEKSVFTSSDPGRSAGLAAGAGTVGLAVFGPAGVVGSVLVRGREVEFAPGAEFDLVTAETVSVTVFRP